MTDGDVITALGGPTRLASALGLSLKQVGNWKARGIPYKHRFQVLNLLAASGQPVPPAFMWKKER